MNCVKTFFLTLTNNAIKRRSAFTFGSNLVLKQYHFDNKICRLVLNDPKTRNSLSLAMLESLQKHLTACSNEDQLRVVVIAAQPPVFSAGHDLKELTEQKGKEYHEKVFGTCSKLMAFLQNMQIPVIAEVKSLAAAAGCQLVASCDIVIAGESAKFMTPGAKAGIFCSTPGIAVSRCVPVKVAMDMVLVGDPLDADDAMTAGLVSRLVPDDKVEEETFEVAKKICALSKPVVALGKKFFYEQIEQTRENAYKNGEKVMVENLRLVDAQEGIKAFIEKRKPNWTNENKNAY